jgi:alpha-tubulin suppressor-like RCC1 family protein
MIGRIRGMKIITNSRICRYFARAIIFLVMIVLITGMVGCGNTGGGDYYCLTIASTEGGSVTNPGEGKFICYTEEMVALVAEAGERYHFVEWTGDVDTIADIHDPSTNIAMYDSYSITANFELDEGWCSLTISSTPGNPVTTPGEGTFIYSASTVVDLVAEHGEHFHFVNWTGDVSNIADAYDPSTDITMYDSYSITAAFELDEDWCSLTISSNPGGSVTEPGEGISTHGSNTAVALVAQPDEGYRFVNWTGNVGTIADVYDASTDIAMYDSYSITANFAANFMVAVGCAHTVGLRNDGMVLAAGYNDDGQCNVGRWKGIIQVAASCYHTIGLKSDGTVVAVGWNQDGQCDVGSWTDIVQVACGDYHTVGLRSDGTVVATGWNGYGQCNVGRWTDIVQVAADCVDTVGLKSDGTAVAVGVNDFGQCNLRGWTDIIQIAVGNDYTVGLKSDGTVVAVGRNNDRQCNVGCWTNIVQVDAGQGNTVGLRSNGTVVTAGRNDYGQCDVGGWSDIIQVAAGGAHTVGLKPDGTVVAVGKNDYGQCDVGWTLITYEGWYSLIIPSTFGGSVTEPGEGIFTHAANTTVALVAQPDEDYQFVEWTGDVDTIDNVHAAATSITMYDSYFITAIFGWFDITQVDAGWYFTVGLKSDGTVVAVGDNDSGQCDVGNWTDITQVSAGTSHTVGLKSDGTVVAVGAEVPEFLESPEGPEEFYPGPCDVGDWTNIIQVAAGGGHTVGLKKDGTVVAVGGNLQGQCNVSGWTDIIQVATGLKHTVGLKSDGTVVTVGDNDYGQCNVGNWTDIIQVAAGGWGHTLGLKPDGTVIAVGDNNYGQCDVASWTDITQVAAHVHTVGLRSDGTVVAVGAGGSYEDYNDDEGQCDVGSWTDIIQVAAGRWHTVGLKSDGTVVALGDNILGQCNIGG